MIHPRDNPRVRELIAAGRDDYRRLAETWEEPKVVALPLIVATAPKSNAAPGSHGCLHYAEHWCCNGELRLTCAIGQGQGGVLDGDECAGCSRGVADSVIAPPSRPDGTERLPRR